jgi:tungstate transport system substrate-binding protein
MGATLNMAASMDAYTITDRGTWLSFNNKQDLDILFSGVPPLHNQYSVIVINPEIHQHVKYKLASDFSNWLVSNEGQKLISEFKISGKQLFFPNYKE